MARYDTERLLVRDAGTRTRLGQIKAGEDGPFLGGSSYQYCNLISTMNITEAGLQASV